MDLIGITQRGRPAKAIRNLSEIAAHVLETTAGMYRGALYLVPWIGYLAVEHDQCVGTCAFKTPPKEDQVEIAYFTFPGHEGRGVATRMASRLLDIARLHAPTITVTAQTLPLENASNAILRKLGFEFHRELDHPTDGRVWEWKQEP